MPLHETQCSECFEKSRLKKDFLTLTFGPRSLKRLNTCFKHCECSVNDSFITVERSSMHVRTKFRSANEFFIHFQKMFEEFFDPMSEKLRLLPDDNDQFYIDLNVYTPSFLKYQDIICSCESTQGNPIILKKRILL